MDRAIQAMRRGGMGLNDAAKLYDVPKATLSRHEQNQNIYANEVKKFHGGASPLMSKLEDDLVQHSLVLEERYFGLAMNDLRLEFELAESNAIPKTFS